MVNRNAAASAPDSQLPLRMQWGVKIPMRDAVQLNATLYLPAKELLPAPVVFTLTPYVAQTYHDQGVYFAERGYPYLTIDVRGRGNSEGEFNPYVHEAHDGADIVEWLADQPYCDGHVAMWGGSYAGFNQWATARERPRHLATIVPAASVYMGVDFPMLNNIFWPYIMQWLTFTSGRALQDRLFEDHELWARLFRGWFESGLPFNELDRLVGNPSAIFQEWISHPTQDAYWDRLNPSAEQLAALSIPVLTITGHYDNAQRGALTYYREHMKHAPAEARERHYLVLGPWDHAGTRAPSQEVGGLKLGPASLLDLRQLHLEWYDWTMRGKGKPAFFKKRVAYYVTGAEIWRYADTLGDITQRYQALYLDSRGAAAGIFASGTLQNEIGAGAPDVYVHDAADVRHAALEEQLAGKRCLRPLFPTDSLIDQRELYAKEGTQLIYHSAPFEADVEISGTFRLTAWLAIDQPDTDFSVSIFAVDGNGESVLLTSDWLRARYRESLRQERLIDTTAPLRYDFTRFTFISRRLERGSRLRLVLGPLHSIFAEKNYQSGGVLAAQSMNDARRVTVRLFHEPHYPSALFVPLGQPM